VPGVALETTVSDDAHLACHKCGSVWLRLRAGVTDDGVHDGLVCVNLDGSIAGYTGILQCSDCHVDVALPDLEPEPQPTLRLVR
jgi:hypothetical protein